ncbi:uncharacterized protein N0V89_008061 [Didymosphaeria variabile]|uniref:F-box domain-containing protein n=1 Tax=Didymosphaeria variabile TaxID=1932322 RepID=A0A9W9C854_9PLEO|nr:uncharacterized protein N0V89_008061 [Didymosphaeria variabile]KAJ4349446.1 hypothetical protein N0V89_008061 [Didymosphaeria variabile]
MMATGSASRLETLPTELIQHIIAYLPHDSPVLLGCASRTLYEKVGNTRVKNTVELWYGSRNDLQRDTPAWVPCFNCQKFRPYTSEHAWPYLKLHREKRHIPSTVYGLSFFLDRKVTEYLKYQGHFPFCSALLTCAGTCHKPLSPADRSTLEGTGFDSLDATLGLPIQYKASPRIYAYRAKHSVIVHIRYRISTPHPWTSFTTPQRYAILRGFYLCPHTYASKVQHRDKTDPTYPADSSIAHWLPHQGPVPEAQWRCKHCPSEFVSNFKTTDERGRNQLVFDVWKTTLKRCNEGVAEMTLCKTQGAVEMVVQTNLRTAWERAEAI